MKIYLFKGDIIYGQKAIIIAIILSLCAFSSCGYKNDDELEKLKSENEALKSQISEISETTNQTTAITSETSVTTVPQLSKEDIKSIISVYDTAITYINSADGVNVAVYWRNNSNKQIKYITFTFSIKNAVNDVIKDTITDDSLFNCRLTGPIEPTINEIQNGHNEIIDPLLYIKNTRGSWTSLLNKDEYNYMVYAEDFDYKTGEWIFHEVKEDEYDKLAKKAEWETIMYNSTANSVNLLKINIEYMDNTTITLNQDEIALAYN